MMPMPVQRVLPTPTSRPVRFHATRTRRRRLVTDRNRSPLPAATAARTAPAASRVRSSAAPRRLPAADQPATPPNPRL
jgi:hypothetical protein